MRLLARWTFVSLALLVGCGDDDGPAPRPDAGPPVDGSSDSDAGSMMMTVRRRFLADAPTAAERTPIEGVRAAFDLGGARYEGVSDAMGNLDVVMPRAATIPAATYAKERYAILTRIDGPGVPVGSSSVGDRMDVILFPTTPTGSDVRVILSATGVPAGGRWCAGPGEWYAVCVAAGDRVDVTIDSLAIRTRVTGVAIDAGGAVVDFAEATLTGTGAADRSATIAFDGTPAVTPMTRTVTLQMPADVASVYRTTALIDPDEARPFIAVEPTTHLLRSAVTSRTRAADGSSYSMTVTWFPAPGESPVWAMAAFTAPSGEAYAYRWFAGQVDQPSYTLLDGPRITGRPAAGVYTFPYTWNTTPGAERYVLNLVNNAGRIVWIVATLATAGVQLPALPAGYDRTVSFPIEGANGYAQVRAVVGTPPDPAVARPGVDPYRVDAQSSLGPREPITF